MALADKLIDKNSRKQALLNKLSAKIPTKQRNSARQKALQAMLKG